MTQPEQEEPLSEAPGATQGLLTTAEKEAAGMAGRLYTMIAAQVTGHGATREDDIAELSTAMSELRRAVHVIQRMILAQAAARAYPGSYRLLGEEVSSGDRMVPVIMSRQELLAVLVDIRDRVAGGDSSEGNIQYMIPDEEEDAPAMSFAVQACYRTGNTMGQGGMRMIGRWE